MTACFAPESAECDLIAAIREAVDTGLGEDVEAAQ